MKSCPVPKLPNVPQSANNITLGKDFEDSPERSTYIEIKCEIASLSKGSRYSSINRSLANDFEVCPERYINMWSLSSPDCSSDNLF